MRFIVNIFQSPILRGHLYKSDCEEYKSRSTRFLFVAAEAKSTKDGLPTTKVDEFTPSGLDRSLLLETGAEANEAAVKMAELGTGKFKRVTHAHSWHGTLACPAVTSNALRKGRSQDS